MPKDTEESNFPPGVSVALVEPQFALNVGYVGRAMANFGLKQLYIVSAEKRHSIFDESEALKFASHGDYVIKNMLFLDDLDDLRDRFDLLVGTTAIRGRRKSNLTRKTLGLKEAISSITRSLETTSTRTFRRRSKEKDRGRLCFVFGRDTTGLTNEELRKCDYAVTISTGTRYNTLNISHAAAILFYSFSTLLRASRPSIFSKLKEYQVKKPEENSSRFERERTVLLFQELARTSDFPAFKKEKLRETLVRLLDRSNPSIRELYLLMGMANKARRKIEILSANGPPHRKQASVRRSNRPHKSD